MKKDLEQKIEIPQGVEVKINKSLVIAKGKEGEVKRNFKTEKIEMKKDADTIILSAKKATKREKKLMNTITAHIKNLLEGVQNKFEYKLKICFSHFPFTVQIEGNKAIIKNYLGEKTPREVKIPAGVEVNSDKQFVTITGVNKEIVGQAAANFEKMTRAKGRDKRVFQDGIFLVNKAGREI